MDTDQRLDKLERKLDAYMKAHADSPNAHAPAFEAHGFAPLRRGMFRKRTTVADRRHGLR